MEIGEFARHVLAYCLHFSASVTSWIRTMERNGQVGGAANSRHLEGLAVDVVYDGAAPGPEADTDLRARGLLRIREGDHDHIMVPRSTTA